MNKNKNIAILLIIGAAFFFALMNLFVRLSGDLPLMQKCFFRNIVAFFAAAFTMIKERESVKIPKGSLKYLLGRSICGTLGILGNFYAVGTLALSDASMLNKLSPFFAMIFSVWLVKEKANALEWSLVAIAFGGAMLIVKPKFNLNSIPGLCGFLGGMGAGAAYTFVRKLGQLKVKSSLIIAFFSAFSCIATLPSLIFNYHSMTLYQFLMLMLAGVAASGGQFCITGAYKRAPAKEISVFDYSQVIFAAVLGYIFLGQIADIWSVLGYVIIISVAVIKWIYNMKKDENTAN